MVDIKLRDFQPVNDWAVDPHSPKFMDGTPSLIIDKSTERPYLNEDRSTVRQKCFLLTLGTPIVHSIATCVNLAYRVAKIATLSHFWRPSEKPGSYDLKGRAKSLGVDLLRCLATPLAPLALQLTAIYGLFRPYDGRKLYATIERAHYGSFILAPCFQPRASCHLFCGDINQRNAF